MTKAVYEMLLGYMQSCVADRAHDENHVLRVLSNALQIAREEPQADLDILMAACLLVIVIGLVRTVVLLL